MIFPYSCGHWVATKKQKALPPHRNPGLELVLVLNGSVTWELEGATVTTQAPEISFTWPWQWHGVAGGALPASELCWLILPFQKIPKHPGDTMRLERGLGLHPAECDQLLKTLLALRRPVVRASRRLLRDFPEVVARMIATDYQPDFRARALILGILADLLELAGSQPPQPPEPATEKVTAFLTNLTETCGELWSLEDMAAACGLGRTQFARWVKVLTGETPGQFLTRQRVLRATRLLHETQQSVTEIALACGFSSSQYFSTVYREFHGKCPTADRQNPPTRLHG